jgi:hypothetical protein
MKCCASPWGSLYSPSLSFLEKVELPVFKAEAAERSVDDASAAEGGMLGGTRGEILGEERGLNNLDGGTKDFAKLGFE